MKQYDDYDSGRMEPVQPVSRPRKKATASGSSGGTTSARKPASSGAKKSAAAGAAAPRSTARSAAQRSAAPGRSATQPRSSAQPSSRQTSAARKSAPKNTAPRTAAPRQSARRPAAKGRKKRRANPMVTLAYWLIAIAIAFVISFFVHEYLFELVRVNGDAMHQTLNSGDLTIVSKTAYGGGNMPQRGDIVAVRVDGEPGFIIRRVLAGPGQTIEVAGEDTIVDGQILLEDYVTMLNYADFPTKTLPSGKYYVLGDNRSEVSDSRSDAVGLISEQDIVGRVVYVVWPFSRLRSM